jgi:uncharacterized protein
LRVHANKPAIRVLGVAESFRLAERFSTLAGVVMRGDRLVDGIAFGRATVGGDDATAGVLKVFRALRRKDINVIMLSGCIISLYNVVEVDLLARKAGVPVLCLTYKESAGIESSIRRHFGDGEVKVAMYRRLGAREALKLATGKTVYVRRAGISPGDAARVLEVFTLQGRVPEPVRVARLLARARRASP